MIGNQLIDLYARDISDEKQHSVLGGASAGTEKRYKVLHQDYQDPDALRKLAASIKDHTLHHLDEYLAKAEQALVSRGVKVHFAATGDDAKQTILDILRGHGVTRLTKSKSMAAEEIHLNPFLIENGIECLESDLGEFIVQLDDDIPSHIVKPIIHKNRREIARTFLREGIAADYNDDPEAITRRARVFLREKYMQAEAGITGANFVCADSGRMLLITNEGNSRFGMAPVPVHIALVGIEKIIPREKDLSVFLNLLGRSATGQQLTVYTEFINGPKSANQPDGPEHMHVVFMDNGRTDVLASNCREILRCIRCGACRPGRRGALAIALRRPFPRTRGSSQSLLSLRRLQRSLPGGHPDSRFVAASARQGPQGARPLARRHPDGPLRHPRHLALALAHRHDHVQGDEPPAHPGRADQAAARLARHPHPARVPRRRFPEMV